MSADAITALTAVQPFEMLAPATALPNAEPAVAGTEFGNWFSQQLSEVNGKLMNVDHEVQTLAVGGSQSLHQVIIHMEEAKLSFQLLAQVRNHLLEAYQEVMRMQV
jgi:flagellar hook-basal body complex protein FliE